MERRKSCKLPEGEPCVAVGRAGLCGRCSDTKAQSERMKALNADPEFKARMKALNAARLSWCPLDLVEDYRLLARHIGAAEARAVIERQIAQAEAALDGARRFHE